MNSFSWPAGRSTGCAEYLPHVNCAFSPVFALPSLRSRRFHTACNEAFYVSATQHLKHYSATKSFLISRQENCPVGVIPLRDTPLKLTQIMSGGLACR